MQLRNLNPGDPRAHPPPLTVSSVNGSARLLCCLVGYDFAFPPKGKRCPKELQLQNKCLQCTSENGFISHPVTQAKIPEVILETSFSNPSYHHSSITKFHQLDLNINCPLTSISGYHPGPSYHYFSLIFLVQLMNTYPFICFGPPAISHLQLQ